MGKKSRQRTRTAVADQALPDGAVGPRQPCPCGSGRRYKHCHGGGAGAAGAFVRRPFAGLASEADIVALREFVPAATAPLPLVGSDRPVLLGSLLPGASPALVRSDGTIWLGLQVQHAYGDPSRDLAAVLELALEAGPDSVIGLPDDPGEGPRLQDLVVDAPLEVTVHAGFDFWLSDVDDDSEAAGAALQQANDAVNATEKVAGVEAAYWTSVGDREYLRWVMARDEDEVLDGLARLHAAGADQLAEGTRLIGMFRAHGLAVPVWDLPLGTGAEALAAPAARLVSAFEDALSGGAPLSAEERAARAGLASRQLTIR